MRRMIKNSQAFFLFVHFCVKPTDGSQNRTSLAPKTRTDTNMDKHANMPGTVGTRSLALT